ncbi:hypothetical protein PLANPX_1957 [Lacipirellula parvula]|uniref:Uncharacterized protein n=2 Tax=Lacipirellula parvula TaxID=2650471 RepID=A0A5K7X7J0_9BACT|nr:hypothetical protein PLANPX_1957 [Lacipirellula parvula]
MDGAALFALIAAVGFGWQPMPDGSERYEYIVQVDEELAATLASGKSIPIVGEVPDDIRPIGWVRVVIGDGAPPRERMVTRLKPVVAATMAKPELPAEESIVVRGQNAVGSADYNRYGEIPQQLSQQAAATANAVTNAATEAWNGGSTPAPSGQALFDNAVASGTQAWNENVAGPAANAMNDAAQNLQTQLGNSVQQGFNNASNQVQQSAQNAAASLGERTSSVINELRNPQARQPATTSRDVRNQPAPLTAVAPPATGSAATGAPPAIYGDSQPANSWNQDSLPTTTPLQSNAQSPAPSAAAGSTWNNTATAPFPTAAPLANQGTSGLGNGSSQQQPTQYSQQQQQPASGAPAANEWNSDNFAASQPATNGMGGVNNTATNNNTSTSNPWQGVADPRVPATTAGSTSSTPGIGVMPPQGDLANGQTRPFGGGGSQWSGDSPIPSAPPLASETNLAGTGSTLSPSNTGAPAISVGMMNQNPNRPLDEVAGAAGTGTPATHASTGQTTPPATMNRDIFNSPRSNQPTNGQPAGAGQGGSATMPTANTQANAAAGTGGRDNAFIALVAWVLLFGSAFGNLYLFWSYLDVRQKYRSLVRKTARAVGSRFSAA